MEGESGRRIGEGGMFLGLRGCQRENLLISNVGGGCSEKVGAKSKMGVFIELPVMIIFLHTHFTSETYKIT